MSFPQKTQRSIIVVGSGLAGLSAATTIVQTNPKIPVVILEKFAKPGGNSIKASSGINGANTIFQHWPDTSFESDTIKSSGNSLLESDWRNGRLELISEMCTQSKESVEWLSGLGVDLTRVARLGGHSVARTHRGDGPVPPGASIITTLLKLLQGKAQLKLECEVTKILTDDEGKVIGVEYNGANRLYGPVIFTTGGFAGSHEYISKYAPELINLPTTNSERPGTQHLLSSLGVELVDMSNVQIHPTGWVEHFNRDDRVKFLAPEALRGEGGILINDKGDRFVNELDTRKRVSDAIINTIVRDPYADPKLQQYKLWILLDEETYKSTKASSDFYLAKKLLWKTNFASMEASFVNIRSTLQAYGSSSKDPFNRPTRGNWNIPKFTPETVLYIGQVTPVVHFTMGGAKFNTRAQPLTASGPVSGLWVAGEITGGIHGDNRLGGSSLLECAVFGRIAGSEAVKYYEEQ
ncbi:unnamed protein product [Kuraishia capsulata CBS 1993]|uniref:Fumarate reductase n=1 Tax=Kuraishia capsulata CBS 1993 TaxID=1382522 RepID=W6MSN0_9ASCO|nr:uncharacterized protein KUCA_T00004214001 [Kuraishia capsulata CBS 1993]CDK28232.1 unnamed protein product [Kuraishia capsulata CBS 1993]